MAVPTQLSDLSATAASNSPAGTDTVGTTMDDFIRAHASIIARISAGTDALATPALGAPTAAGRISANLGLTVAGGTLVSRGLTDSATATALTLSGSGANSVTIANSATNPTIGTSAGDLMLAPEANTALVLANIASAANYLYVQPGVLANENVVLRPAGAATNCALVLSSKGSGGIALDTGTATLIQVLVQHTASADRYITLTGSNGGNPTIGTSAGSLAIGTTMLCAAGVQAKSATATPAGGAVGFYMGSDSVGIYWGSGAPTVSAARGSLYIRTDNGANTSLYVNRDGITNWVAVTSA